MVTKIKNSSKKLFYNAIRSRYEILKIFLGTNILKRKQIILPTIGSRPIFLLTLLTAGSIQVSNLKEVIKHLRESATN